MSLSDGKVNRRPLSFRAFRPDASAMPGDDALDDGQPDAGAGKFFLGVQALEGCEELIGIAHIETGAIVSHIKDAFMLLRLSCPGRCARLPGFW